MNTNNLPVKWYASPVGEPVRDETTFLYTSKEAPVEADEYERMKQRAEAAEQQLMVYRVLLTGAMMAAAQASGLPPIVEPFANGYFTALFQVALDSGAFAEAGCGTTGILTAAEQLHVKFPFAEE